jgi:hypothetical protein
MPGTDFLLFWYVLHIRRGFVPVTVKKLKQLNLEFIVPTNVRDVIFAKLPPEQCPSVSFIVGVRAMRECTTELVREENPIRAAEFTPGGEVPSMSA